MNQSYLVLSNISRKSIGDYERFEKNISNLFGTNRNTVCEEKLGE